MVFLFLFFVCIFFLGGGDGKEYGDLLRLPPIWEMSNALLSV